MKAVFDHEYVKRINGPNVKEAGSQDGQGGNADGGYPAIPRDHRRFAAW